MFLQGLPVAVIAQFGGALVIGQGQGADTRLKGLGQADAADPQEVEVAALQGPL
ncbi:hypothetical protein D3C78_1748670 [compost metagenome]